MLKILYPENIRFPMERANSIQIINTCYALAKNNNKVYLLVRKMNNIPVEEIFNYYNLQPHPRLKIIKLPVINTNRSNLIWNYSYYFSLFTFLILKSLKPDIVFTRNISFANIFSRFKKIFNYKVILEIHTLDYVVRKKFKRFYTDNQKFNHKIIKKIKNKEESALNNADGIIVITNSMKSKLVQIFNLKTPVAVIPDGTNVFPEEQLINNQKREGIYYIGQFYKWKGVENLIKAAKYINNEKIFIIGGLPYEKDLQELKKLTAILNLTAKIEFKDFVPPKLVKKYFLKAKIGVLPFTDNLMAKYFTSPLKLFEFMAAKVPIVASDLPSIREILTNGETAVLVEPNNPRAFAEGINKLLQDENFAKKIAENAYQEVKKYTWDKRAKKIIEFVNLL